MWVYNAPKHEGCDYHVSSEIVWGEHKDVNVCIMSKNVDD